MAWLAGLLLAGVLMFGGVFGLTPVPTSLWGGLPLTLLLSLLLIQPVKGAVVALQWHAGMHGFEESKKLRGSVEASG
jgi:uncharacterized protein (DUF983 family)